MTKLENLDGFARKVAQVLKRLEAERTESNEQHTEQAVRSIRPREL